MTLNEVYQDQSSHNDETGKKLREALDQALSAIVYDSEPTDPQAKVFKRQIELMQEPKCSESDARKEQIINEWLKIHRDDLNDIFAEIKFFRRKN